MSTIVLLSSSPPQVFARSPTPADSSSPLPSAASLFQNRSPSRNKFKPKAGDRNGFSTSFSTARQVLQEKSGAQNTLIMSPRRTRFRSSQEELSEKVASDLAPRSLPSVTTAGAEGLPKPSAANPTKVRKQKAHPVEQVQSAQNNKTTEPEEGFHNPLSLERAAARKTDWTPPKPATTKCDEENTIQYSAGYMNGTLSNFTYAGPNLKYSGVTQVEANPAKRRKVELPWKANRSGSACASGLSRSNSVSTKTTSSRTRSPIKKPLTITGLATSNYLGQDQAEDSPIMQYLSSTQAQLQDTSVETGLETKIQKTKAAVQKLKTSKKKKSESLLLSPQSAIQTYDGQEAIFGSASQLVREESPTLLRDTIEAMKQSESFLMSDPILSSQRTQPLSAENTPKAGTSRFQRTRGLWSAAGRDVDNALLHIDTVDLTDSPAIRAAFTGKDVMVQPCSRKTDISSVPSLRVAHSPLIPMSLGNVVDIDSVVTPHTVSMRKFSTTRTSTNLEGARADVQTESTSDRKAEEPDKTVQPKKVPPKPNYNGFTIPALNKLIKSYGFKTMRKREKMIELLDRCWEEKYDVPPVESEPKAAPFGDFISNVHDISARPEPKVKKARIRKKKDEVGKDSDQVPKKPRQRKKKDCGDAPVNDATEKPKPKRVRKPKSTLASDTSIADIDLIVDSIPEELRALQAFDDWAKPEKTPKPRKRPEPLAKENTLDLLRPPTPPATLPLEEDLHPALQAANDLAPDAQDGLTAPSATPGATPELLSIDGQITAAIIQQSKRLYPGRNHNLEPTWHEKILLYDPIVLEDLAAWLNTEGFAAIGEDREVSALEVREWLETRGVCCLWRGGWRGNKAAQS